MRRQIAARSAVIKKLPTSDVRKFAEKKTHIGQEGSSMITCDILNETKKVSFKLTVTKLDDKKTSSPLQTVMEFFLFHSKANRINLYEIVQKSFEPVTLTRVKINLVTI